MAREARLPPLSTGVEARPDERALIIRLVALLGIMVAAVLAIQGRVDALGAELATALRIAAIGAYGAGTGYLAFRAGGRGMALTAFAPEILRELTVGVVLTDENFRVVHANPAFARMVGRAPEAVAGMAIADSVYPADLETYALQSARRTRGQSDTFRIRLAGPGGKPVPTVIIARPLLRNGQFAGALGLLYDVSEAAEARVQATEARYLSGFLFDAFTHDLSNSLQVVMGRLAVAEALARSGSPRATLALGSAVAAAERAAKELREIKQIARSATADLKLRPMSARDLVHEAVAIAELEPLVAVLTDMPASISTALVQGSDLAALALSKLIEEASGHGGAAAPAQVTVELRSGELGPSTVVARVRGCHVTLPLDDLAIAMSCACDTAAGETAWRSGVRLVLAATVAKPHHWALRALRDEDGVGTVFELRMPAEPAIKAPTVALVPRRRSAPL